jgi:hypothetical protein
MFTLTLQGSCSFWQEFCQSLPFSSILNYQLVLAGKNTHSKNGLQSQQPLPPDGNQTITYYQLFLSFVPTRTIHQIAQRTPKKLL